MEASIIIPLGTDQRFLGEALESVVRDTRRENVEIILVGSVEAKLECSRDYIFRNLEYISHKGEGTVANNLNIGIDSARGTVIFRMDADDIWNRGRFAIQMAQLEKSVAPVSLGTASHMNSKGLPIPRLRGVREGEKFDATTLMIGNSLVHPAIAYAKDWISLRKYEASKFEDWNLWLRERKELNGLSMTNSPVVRYRIHKRQISRNTKIRADDPIMNTWREALLDEFGYSPEMQSSQYFFNREVNCFDTNGVVKTLVSISQLLLENGANKVQVHNLMMSFSPSLIWHSKHDILLSSKFLTKAILRELMAW